MLSKPVKVSKSKVDNNQTILAEGGMGYDIIEDIKKTKEKISLFEMCNLPQQRKKLFEAFDSQTNKS